MANLYLITGPAGVGKSTISKGIAEKLNKSVLLEGDDFYHHVIGSYVSPWMEGNHLDIFWKVSIDTIKNYLEADYDVIFNYIINIKDYNKLKEKFKNYNVYFVVLLVNEENIIERDKLRDEDVRMNERCIVLLRNFEKSNYPVKYKLYTDNMSIEETINEIIDNERYLVNDEV